MDNYGQLVNPAERQLQTTSLRFDQMFVGRPCDLIARRRIYLQVVSCCLSCYEPWTRSERASEKYAA